jgi:hypothetical protein
MFNKIFDIFLRIIYPVKVNLQINIVFVLQKYLLHSNHTHIAALTVRVGGDVEVLTGQTVAVGQLQRSGKIMFPSVFSVLGQDESLP